MEQGICIFDKDDRLVTWNQAFVELAVADPECLRAGMSSTELARELPWTGIGSAVPARIEPAASAIGEPKEQYLMEAVPEPGAWADPVSPKGYVLRVSGLVGADGGYVVVFTDASAQKRLEAHLRESEQRFRDFAEASSVWFWEMGPDLRFTYMSNRVEELAGVPVAWHLGKTRQEVAGKNIGAEAWRQHEEVLARRESFRDFEFWRLRPDGSIQWIATSGTPRFDASGNFLGYRGTGREITERKQAEEQRGLLAAIVASSDDAIIGKTLDGTITSWNEGAERLYGYAAKEAIGGSIKLILPPDREEELFKIFDRLQRGERVEPFETERVRKDGARVTISLAVSPILNAAGRITGASAIARDVTERKRMEQERQHAMDELARSNRDLQQFANVVSHDLREPLRAVAGYCELLRRRYRGKLDADADKFIGHAVEGAERMQGLIHDLLEYSRVGYRGRLVAPTDLNAVVSQARRNLNAAIKESGAVIESDQLPVLDGDQTQLVQLFQNLLGNAIKYRSAAPPAVRIAAEQHKGVWMFSVSDNGIGIDSRFGEQVFEIFTRLHTREEYPGTGIGLALCKRIVERHGGTIWLDPETTRGSRFCFTIPAVPPPGGDHSKWMNAP